MEQNTKRIVKALIVGSVVAIGVVPLTSVLLSVLGFIPQVMLGGISIPHGLIGAGVLAGASDWATERYIR